MARTPISRISGVRWIAGTGAVDRNANVLTSAQGGLFEDICEFEVRDGGVSIYVREQVVVLRLWFYAMLSYRPQFSTVLPSTASPQP